jgi:isoleucyl-tRNA synthetase
MELSSVELSILKFWKEHNCFEKQLEISKDFKKFTFYDGPPFATGLPHYGHILASTIKDTITRYKSMTGYFCPRVFGWDCITEGTLINLMDGTGIPIEKFNDFDSNVESFNLEKGGFTFEKKTLFMNKGEKECIELEFFDGNKLICTPNHKIYTNNGWMEAKDLIINDTEIYSTYKNPELIDFFNDYDWKLDADKIKLSCDNIIEKRKAAAYVRLLGFMLADGCIFENKSKNTIVSYVYFGHELDAKMYVEDIFLLTGFRPKYRLVKTVYAVDLPRNLVYSFASLDGIVIGKRINQGNIIPKFLLKEDTPKFLKQEFLSGFFGGDGHTTGLKKHPGGTYNFSYCCISKSKNISMLDSLKEMMNNIEKLLNDIGIFNINILEPRETTVSKTKENTNDKSFELLLIIKKDSMISFCDKIGFRYCIHKKLRLGITKSYLLYEQMEIENKMKCKEWLEDTNNLKYMEMKYIVDRNIQYFPYYLTKLVSKKNIGSKNVYDITIDNTHNFVANGIVVHNCHGLPIEYEIEKKLGIKTKEEILNFGIGNYNEECRSIVLKYRGEWKKTMERLGRWVDMENDYKTMDKSFMESVWWVFKQLFEKGLVYQGVKVMPYSMACATPLSNFEAKSNYQTVNDPSIVVKFNINFLKKSNIYFLVWTTTPWTLPSNLAICVHPELEYVLLDTKNGEKYILARSRLNVYFEEGKYRIERTYLGKELEGIQYVPLFPYFENEFQSNSFKVLCDTYVSADNGTGIVHQAPAFGEDDYRVCMKAGIITKEKLPPCPLTANCCFTEKVSDFKDLNVKEADKIIMKNLKDRNMMFLAKYEHHEYPYCWRSNTPLIYRSLPCWFIAVEKIKDRIVANNQQIHWTPGHIKDGRFGQWLKESRDWCVSRNRYWGTPLPIWTNENGTEIIVIGSVSELEELAGLPKGSVVDLHSHHIDHITIPGKTGILRRCSEVFDCWFESGSMPFASKHFPFSYENPQDFLDQEFPGDFIAEGLDQTRGWFYTLMVLSTGLYDKPAFKNVIVNGLVLAEDGEKMSKSKRNYPDPNIIIEKYGSDGLRMYLLSTPVIRADDLKFSEKGVHEIVRQTTVYLNNSLEFFKQMYEFVSHQYGKNMKFYTLDELKSKITNILDNWILHELQDLYNFVHKAMNNYDMFGIIAKIIQFVDNLSKWYMNMNKRRFKLYDFENFVEYENSMNVLYQTLLNFAIIYAPFSPFFAEHIYQTFKLYDLDNVLLESVHYCQIPEKIWESNSRYLDLMSKFKKIVDLSRYIRGQNRISQKQPLQRIVLFYQNDEFKEDMMLLEEYLTELVNYIDIEYRTDEDNYVRYYVELVPKLLGKKLGKKLQIVSKYINKLNDENYWTKSDLSRDIYRLNIEGEEYEFTKEELKIRMEKKSLTGQWDLAVDGEVLLLVNLEITDEILYKFEGKKLSRRIMNMRKKSKLVPKDTVLYGVVEYGNSEMLKTLLSSNGQKQYIYPHLHQELLFDNLDLTKVLLEETIDVFEDNVKIALIKMN